MGTKEGNITEMNVWGHVEPVPVINCPCTCQPPATRDNCTRHLLAFTCCCWLDTTFFLVFLDCAWLAAFCWCVSFCCCWASCWSCCACCSCCCSCCACCSRSCWINGWIVCWFPCSTWNRVFKQGSVHIDRLPHRHPTWTLDNSDSGKPFV